MDICLISTFYVCADGFLGSFSLPYENIKFLFASLNLVSNSKEQAKTFVGLVFSSTKKQKIEKNHQRMYRK
jgi:hypothetical protein